ncbi:MAG: pseudouridine synthase [Anaerococcus obesiensis]
MRDFCAGRLDKDSHGLMIITNDGKITNKIIHPSKKIDKIYIVKVDKNLQLTKKKFYGWGKIIAKRNNIDAKISLIDKEKLLKSYNSSRLQ